MPCFRLSQETWVTCLLPVGLINACWRKQKCSNESNRKKANIEPQCTRSRERIQRWSGAGAVVLRHASLRTVDHNTSWDLNGSELSRPPGAEASVARPPGAESCGDLRSWRWSSDSTTPGSPSRLATSLFGIEKISWDSYLFQFNFYAILILTVKFGNFKEKSGRRLGMFKLAQTPYSMGNIWFFYPWLWKKEKLGIEIYLFSTSIQRHGRFIWYLKEGIWSRDT